MGDEQVIVVVPVYHFPLSCEEEISVTHLLHFLGEYNLSLVAPRSLEIADARLCKFPVTRFDDEYFTGIPGYNRLMLSKGFYHRFRQYEYILIYQLDCLVFSPDLTSWCDKGWDYVGAPWFKEFSNDPTEGFWAVGNGGLSLRRVKSCLAVFQSKATAYDPYVRATRTRLLPRDGFLREWMIRSRAMIHQWGLANNVNWYLRRYSGHEDHFWGLEASRFAAGFTVPSPQEALPFSFECAPRYCLDRNAGRLPFGCHAWHKIDREFWEQFTL
ncbi:MAG: DUF5672 family protein [Solirubrobacterales bacterium]